MGHSVVNERSAGRSSRYLEWKSNVLVLAGPREVFASQHRAAAFTLHWVGSYRGARTIMDSCRGVHGETANHLEKAAAVGHKEKDGRAHHRRSI